MQHTVFHLGTDTGVVWFEGFGGQNIHDFIIVIIAVSLITMLKMILKSVRLNLFNGNVVATRKSTCSRTTSICYHILDTVLLVIDVSFGYALMLAFMSGNVWLCVAIILSSVIGYFASSWQRVDIITVAQLERYTNERQAEAQHQKGAVQRISLFGRPQEDGDASEAVPFLDQCDEGRTPESGADSPPTEATALQVMPNAANEDIFATFQATNSQNNYSHPSQAHNNREANALPPYPTKTELPEYTGPGRYPDNRPHGPVNGSIDSFESDNSVQGSGLGVHRSDSPNLTPHHDPATSQLTKDRSDSNPLFDKYPVLKFHNVNVKSTSPGNSAEGLELSELDRILQDLKDQAA